jgi:hypothetical protein
MAKKRAAAKQKPPTAKSIVMTREEFERTEPRLSPSIRPLTDEEVSEMHHYIVRDSVGAANRLLVEVKRLRRLVGP